ncbi:MAG: hypothetical protein JXQ80_09825 [Bacteroidales bacterium]|nr:hypothetical protein [Bacteroidales bacterium]
MKNLIIPAILLATALFSCDKDEISGEQSVAFIKYYTNFPEFSAADVVQTTSGGYAVLGTAKTATDGTQLCLLITDKYGNTSDSAKLFGRSLNDEACCLKVLGDGGFAILGTSQNPVSERLEALFIRTDASGNVEWNRYISKGGTTGNLVANYFETDDNESFYMTGYRDSTGYGKEIWWYALNSQGSPIRTQKTLPYPSNDEGTHLQVLSDGSVVIAGYITQAGVEVPVILKTNPDGVFDDIYPLLPSSGERGNCIRLIDNDNYLLLGTAKTGTTSNMTLKYVHMSSTNHYLHWSEAYTTITSDAAKCLLVDDDACYLLGTTSTTGNNSSISITKTDLSGELISQQHFGMGTELSAGAFYRTSDNGFIIAGTNRHAENVVALTLIKTGPTIGF